ncbi:heme ABC transporter ATP-binding protein [Terasakiella sp.]|uniref:heme ABC transporter ATP-binding protein n=1 Tax=Terasakiella sp. TaxID=2034861 RepID=UPI003AA8BB51
MLNLQAEYITLRLGNREVVKDVSLSVQRGQLVALIGPNGAGKSSLLRLLSGELAPTSGEVKLNGKALTDWCRKALACRRGVVPQDTHLDFAFSALEVVLMGRSPHLSGSMERQVDYAAALSALDRVQAQDLAHRLYPTLSGGERQRVQIARALAQIDSPKSHDGRLLLLDEHTASLDPSHQHGMFQIAKNIAEEGAGVLAVVHDLNLAAGYADQIGVLDQGRLVAFGKPEDVLVPDVMQSVFGLSSCLTRNPINDQLSIVTAPYTISNPSRAAMGANA